MNNLEWTEITDDPATWPPLKKIVLVLTEWNEVEMLYLAEVSPSRACEHLTWHRPHNLSIAADGSLTCEIGSEFKHLYRSDPEAWRPI